jgi:DNA-directed RNA polymerase sigma subunit (sigma70/sigma32)
MYRLEKEIGRIVTEENRFPSEEELAAKLGIAEKEVSTLMQAMTDSFSLNTELDNESHTEIGDLIEQTTVPPADEELEEQARKRELLDRMEALSSKEKLILCLRHGVTDDMPLHARAIAEFIGREDFEVSSVISNAEKKVCEALDLDRVELAHLLLYLNPNPKASMTFWLQVDDNSHVAGEEQLIRPERVAVLEDLRQHGTLQTTIDGLELEERVMLKLRYGIMTDELTLRDIGELLGLSRERVRQIEARAEAKCRRLVRRGRRPGNG